MTAPKKMKLSKWVTFVEWHQEAWFEFKGTVAHKIYFSHGAGRWICDCRDFGFRQLDKPDGKCKHIKEILADYPEMARVVIATIAKVRSNLLSELL